MARAIVLLAIGSRWLTLASQPQKCRNDENTDGVSLLQLHNSVNDRRTTKNTTKNASLAKAPLPYERRFTVESGKHWRARYLAPGVIFKEDRYGSMLPKGCSRCNGSYPNVIRLVNFRAAGLLDTIANRMVWSQVGALYCARLEARRPCETTLDYIGGDMSRNVTWDHYLNETYRDGTPVFQKPTAKAKGTVTVATKDVYGNKLDFSYQLETVNNLTAAGTPFEWNLDYNWLDAPASMEYLKSGSNMPFIALTNKMYQCQDVDTEPSAAVTDLAVRVEKNLHLKKGNYIAMHIRRGDAKGACNTSIPKVVEYVQCSLKKGGVLSSLEGELPIIFFTDSHDQKYILKLQISLSAALGGRSVYHGDAQVMALAGKNGLPETGGNTFVFEASLLMRMRAGAELIMDRSHCASCETPGALNYCKYPIMVDESNIPSCNFAYYSVQAQMHTTAPATYDGWTPKYIHKAAKKYSSCPPTSFSQFAPLPKFLKGQDAAAVIKAPADHAGTGVPTSSILKEKNKTASKTAPPVDSEKSETLKEVSKTLEKDVAKALKDILHAEHRKPSIN